MAKAKYITFGTILLLIGWFINSNYFDVQYEGDKTCAGTYLDPCEWKYNITLNTVPTYYIYNRDAINLVFLPEVKEVVNCKKDGRYRSLSRANREEYPCGIGWREFDWKAPLTPKYKYVNKFYKGKKQEFKIVVFKFNPEDEIKFGGEITKDEFDPFFYGVSSSEETEIQPNIFKIERCENRSRTEYQTCFNNYIHYHNYTFINNKTGINESRTELINISESYECKPYVVYYKANCKTIGIRNLNIKLTCPPNHCCHVVGNEFCILDENDGDCNYNAKENKGWGWSFKCISIYELREVKISDYKKITVKVETI